MEKHLYKTIAVLFLVIVLSGCVFNDKSDEKIGDCPYIVVEASELPEDIIKLIDSKKETPFQMAYHEPEASYIILGYGRQETSGYHIEVHDVYQGEDSLWVDTDLIGPVKNEPVEDLPTYPYVVIKVKKIDQLVRFKS